MLQVRGMRAQLLVELTARLGDSRMQVRWDRTSDLVKVDLASLVWSGDLIDNVAHYHDIVFGYNHRRRSDHCQS